MTLCPSKSTRILPVKDDLERRMKEIVIFFAGIFIGIFIAGMVRL